MYQIMLINKHTNFNVCMPNLLLACLFWCRFIFAKGLGLDFSFIDNYGFTILLQNKLLNEIKIVVEQV